jgi:dihydrofolate reductase
MRTSVFIATSLDGFIARADGSIDWLPAPDPDSDEDYGYRAFINTVDTLVMGRHTYETALGFDHWPYPDTPVVVLSHRLLNIPGAITGSVEQMEGSPAAIIRRLAERGAEHLCIDGGRTIQRFLAAGCIDRITLTIVPVLLGDGIPLFGPMPHDVPLTHLTTQAFPSGLVQHRYRVRPTEP